MTQNTCPTCGQAADLPGFSASLLKNTITLDGETHSVKPMLAETAHILAKAHPHPVSREQFMAGFYGGTVGGSDNIVPVYLHHLRRLLDGTRYSLRCFKGVGWAIEQA